VATSYANTGGTGNRTAIITVTVTGGFSGSPSVLVNGDLVTNNIWFSGTTAIQFEFTEFKSGRAVITAPRGPISAERLRSVA